MTQILAQENFDKIVASLPEDPLIRGREFEDLCAWFLANSPEYNKQIESVRRPATRDIGVDLEVVSEDGSLWAVQRKVCLSSGRSTT
ncbi:hypothetical protein M1N56_08395 [Dehalococcoidia bacterium]|nr:hypothetical protein [Dehalococcoidia bacterium]